ncbi:SLC13 family permease [Paenibacillus montaniterrae]|uniref:SLC13 family permease n=1 Tax=Paenibacillus montaniterrae TaxID=429341 RepID=A0A919YRJ0_9BACL|nr:SLC13 family permease [Paenibacillus montaniterrae]GIP15633.1 SLC13 family permease [Paenibacillus montaniterrae]
MNIDMLWTLIILAVASVLFVSGKVRSDLVAVCALSLLVMLGIIDTNEALAGFSSSVVIMMIGLFVVGGAIFQTGLAKIASGKLLQLSGSNETRLLLTVMLSASLIGAFVSNTGTVAVMLPVVVSLATSAGVQTGRLLMPLAFAGSLGGMLTLIGTPPNMVISETLEKAGYEPLTFFSFTPIGLICLVAGTLLIALFSKWLLKSNDQTGDISQKQRSLYELASQYSLGNNLYRLQVSVNSPMINKTLKELSISSEYRVHIHEVRRRQSNKNPFFKTINTEFAGPNTMIHVNDVIYVTGEFEDVARFAADQMLELLAENAVEKDANGKMESLATPQIGIAEVLIPSNSKHINQLVKHSGFRENYNVNILGIQRKGKYLLHELKEEKIKAGDALLIQGEWKHISRLAQEHEDVVVVGQPAEAAANIPLSHKAPLAAIIMILMIAAMIINVVPAVVCVMVAAILMVATGCLPNMEAAYKTVNWESIVLIGAMIPMSTAIEKTGAAAMISEGLVNSIGGFGPIALLAGIYFATSLMTLFISNTACAVLFAPIALAAALSMDVNPVPYLFAVSIGASMCFAVPFSTPPNALVMSAGKYKFIDYVKVGMPVQLLLGMVMVIALPIVFPL